MRDTDNFDVEFFLCSKCGHAFSNWHQRRQHEKKCANIIFLDEESAYRPEPASEPPTYQELLKQASEKDPAIYSKYLGRRLITEPNNMIEAWRAIHRKAKSEREENR